MWRKACFSSLLFVDLQYSHHIWDWNNMVAKERGGGGRGDQKGLQAQAEDEFFFFCRLRRPSLNCWEHKRLPVSDPLSIQDQGVIGSNYCKFLCMLSTEREGGKGREESSGTSPPTQLHLVAPAYIRRSPLNLWKRFHPQLPSSSAELISLPSHPSLGCRLLTWLALLSDLTGPEVFRVIMAGSEERSVSLGLWVFLLLGAGMEEVVEGCSCLPAHPQQLFCSSEIGKSLAGRVTGFRSLWSGVFKLHISTFLSTIYCLVRSVADLLCLDFPQSSMFPPPPLHQKHMPKPTLCSDFKHLAPDCKGLEYVLLSKVTLQQRGGTKTKAD